MGDQVLGSVRSRLVVKESGEVLWDQIFFNPEPRIQRLAMDLEIEGVTHMWELIFEPPLEATAEVEVPDGE